MMVCVYDVINTSRDSLINTSIHHDVSGVDDDEQKTLIPQITLYSMSFKHAYKGQSNDIGNDGL